MRNMKYLVRGARQALELCPRGEYIIPSRNGFAQDAENLRGDFARVGKDMYSVTEKAIRTVDEQQNKVD